MDNKIKVLVVDDTVTYRRILSNVIEHIPEAELYGTAPNGSIALKKMENEQADIVLLDIVMPVMDGIDTLEAMTNKYPDTGVIMVSSETQEGADITIRALNKGALDFIQKPEKGSHTDNYNYFLSKLQSIIHMFITKKYAVRARDLVSGGFDNEMTSPGSDRINRKAVPERFDLVIIGVSTGGPKILGRIIPQISPDIGVPILIVQHMPPLFTASLAENLDRISSISVLESSSGRYLEPNTAYIAQGGSHMEIEKSGGAGEYIIRLSDDKPVNSCRPAVDVLCKSVADNFIGTCLLIILTGMGRDGTRGAGLLKQKGAYCIAQDRESSVVFGMPGSVINRGFADEVRNGLLIGERINSLVAKNEQSVR